MVKVHDFIDLVSVVPYHIVDLWRKFGVGIPNNESDLVGQTNE